MPLKSANGAISVICGIRRVQRAPTP